MPKVNVDGLTMNYEVLGEGEPLLLIPYTSDGGSAHRVRRSGLLSDDVHEPTIKSI